MGYGFEGGFTTGGFDEFQCFHISEFEPGDSIIADTPDGKRRGVVIDVDSKSCFLLYRNGAEQFTCSLNDVCFLSEFERGWC